LVKYCSIPIPLAETDSSDLDEQAGEGKKSPDTFYRSSISEKGTLLDVEKYYQSAHGWWCGVTVKCNKFLSNNSCSKITAVH
jgi:hypothetical protein